MFQFQNGTIKSGTEFYLATTTQISFNSKMVQLKVAVMSAVSAAMVKFQFQNGTIKSRSLPKSAQPCLCFNSKMVQLKVIFLSAPSSWLYSFNSKMVQLKVKLIHRTVVAGKFQFQNGTIKRGWPPRSALQVRRFNSKMVQLKGL